MNEAFAALSPSNNTCNYRRATWKPDEHHVFSPVRSVFSQADSLRV